jgi:hypothetical protein
MPPSSFYETLILKPDKDSAKKRKLQTNMPQEYAIDRNILAKY